MGVVGALPGASPWGDWVGVWFRGGGDGALGVLPP